MMLFYAYQTCYYYSLVWLYIDREKESEYNGIAFLQFVFSFTLACGLSVYIVKWELSLALGISRFNSFNCFTLFILTFVPVSMKQLSLVLFAPESFHISNEIVKEFVRFRFTHIHIRHCCILCSWMGLSLSIFPFFVIFAQYLFLLYVGLADCCLPFRCNMYIPCIKTKFNFRFARKEKPYKTANATIPPMESTCIPDLQMWKQRQRDREPASERARERKNV